MTAAPVASPSDTRAPFSLIATFSPLAWMGQLVVELGGDLAIHRWQRVARGLHPDAAGRP